MHRFLLPALLLLGFAVVWGIWPATPTANPPPTAFSGGRARGLVQELAQEPHALGTAGHDRERDRVLARLRGLGLAPEVHAGTGHFQGRHARQLAIASRVENIVARIPGTGAAGLLALAAHYDAVPGGLGAGDDAGGVATVLELARALRSGPPLRHDVLLLLTDGEERGMLGADAFVHSDPWRGQVAVVMNFEGRGDTGPAAMFETSAENGPLIAALGRGPVPAFADSLTQAIYQRMPNDTDLTVFKRAGMAGLNFAYVDGFTRYHAANDDADHLNPGSLAQEGVTALATIRTLDQGDLQNLRGADREYFKLPGVGMVSYRQRWARPAMLLLLLGGLATVLWAAARGIVRPLGAMVAMGVTLAAAGLAALAIFITWRVLRLLHPAFALAWNGQPTHADWYIAGFALIGAAAWRLTWTWLGPRLRPATRLAGALALFLALGLPCALWLPGGAHLLLWPAVAMTLGLLWMAKRGPQRPWTAVPGDAWPGPLLASLVTMAFWAPLIYQLGVILSFTAAGVVGVLVALTLAPAAALLPCGSEGRGA